MKLEFEVYKNSLDELDIEHHRIKVKVTVGLQKFPTRSYNSTVV